MSVNVHAAALGVEMGCERFVVVQPPERVAWQHEVPGPGLPCLLEQPDRLVTVRWMVSDPVAIVLSWKMPTGAALERQELVIAMCGDEYHGRRVRVLLDEPRDGVQGAAVGVQARTAVAEPQFVSARVAGQTGHREMHRARLRRAGCGAKDP